MAYGYCLPHTRSIGIDNNSKVLQMSVLLILFVNHLVLEINQLQIQVAINSTMSISVGSILIHLLAAIVARLVT